MIINQDDSIKVPDNTIAFFPLKHPDTQKLFDIKEISSFLKPLKNEHKRNWFNSHFYKCLPLAIGNLQGFVFSLPYSFSVFWNGQNTPDSIIINYEEDFLPYEGSFTISPKSEFGNGILTIHFPLILKTPPGINLITISPPNFPLPGLSPMTAVVESDNLRFSFTLNIKIDLPNTLIKIEKNSPIAGILPIPRYFCDSFELKNAYDIFDKNIVNDEIETAYMHAKKRDHMNDNNLGQDKLYYSGKDIKGNIFKDHQLPKKNKKH